MHISPRVVVAVLLMFSGLFVLVVVVGLIRDNVESFEILMLLSPIISGILIGGGARSFIRSEAYPPRNGKREDPRE